MLISAQRVDRAGESNRVFVVAAAVSLVLHAAALSSVWGRHRSSPESNPHPVEIELHAKLQAGAGSATAAAAIETGPANETSYTPAPHPRIARVRTHRKPRIKKVAALDKPRAQAPVTAPESEVTVPDAEPEKAPLPTPPDAVPAPAQASVEPASKDNEEQVTPTGGAVASKEAAFAAAEGTGSGDGAALGRGDRGPGKGGFHNGTSDARGVTEPPRPSPYNRRPELPIEARQQGIEGVVRVRLVIDKHGNVARIEVLSGHPLLVEAAKEAIQTWTYTPARAYGEAVATYHKVEVRLSLQDDVHR